jgi:hypothetical protein
MGLWACCRRTDGRPRPYLRDGLAWITSWPARTQAHATTRMAQIVLVLWARGELTAEADVQLKTRNAGTLDEGQGGPDVEASTPSKSSRGR